MGIILVELDIQFETKIALLQLLYLKKPLTSLLFQQLFM